MLKLRLTGFLMACSLGITACGGGGDDTVEGSAPINQTRVIFSPATSEFPVPNDILFSAQSPANGTMNAGTDNNPVIQGIDALDGNSVLAPIDITFDASLNAAQTLSAANFILTSSDTTPVIPNPNQNVFLLPLDYPGGDSLIQASVSGSSVEVPTFSEAATFLPTAEAHDASPSEGTLAILQSLAVPAARAEIISLDDGTNNVLRINPLRPLLPKTKYLIVLTDIEDANGNAVLASDAYTFLKDPESDLDEFGAETEASLVPLRAAIQGWEQLAAGYFGFMQLAGVTSPPSVDDIIFSMTFTTAGTTDVLQAAAAPETFFENSLTIAARQGAIVDLLTPLADPVYKLDGSTTSSDPTDEAIANTLNTALTTMGGPLYNANIANAITLGGATTYYDIVLSGGEPDSSAAYFLQRAVAEVAVQVQGATIEATVAGTVTTVAGALSASVPEAFPVPAPRTNSFYREDPADDIHPIFSEDATVYQGQITLPYYLSPPDERLSPLVTESWEGSLGIATAVGATIDGAAPPVTYRFPFPSRTTDVTVPVLAIAPDMAGKPADGWPVVIFVHGITAERSTALTMGNQLATLCDTVPDTDCFATIAIDQPLHGLTPSGSVFSEVLDNVNLFSVDDPDNTVTPNTGNTQLEALGERHFGARLDASAPTVPVAMDYATENPLDSSGSLFVNLSNFTNARDNLRQMTVDLLNLNASLATIDLDNDGNPDFDTDRVYFIGHSLGAIDGLPFVAINNSDATQDSGFSDQPFVRAAVAYNTGGGITRLLTNSPAFAPTVLGGLAASDVTQGSSSLESYLSVFQGVLDSADVTNFAAMLSEDGGLDTGVLLTEVVGDGGSNLTDQTIPNSADSDLWDVGPLNTTVSSIGLEINGFPAPLAGTEPMLAQFDPEDSDNITDDAGRDVVVSRFTQGTHGTPSSADDVTAFQEFALQTFLFLNADGDVSTGSIVTNGTIIE